MHLQFAWPSMIKTCPNLQVIAFDQDLKEEFGKIMKVVTQPICLQYDTTFNLTGYYVSILSFVKTKFDHT